MGKKKNIIQLNEEMKEIVNDFFNAQKELRLSRYRNSISDGNLNAGNIHLLVIEKVKNAFEKLNEQDKEIINNDFFYQAYPYWWLEGYSKSSYYRHKKDAIIHFLEAYES